MKYNTRILQEKQLANEALQFECELAKDVGLCPKLWSRPLDLTYIFVHSKSTDEYISSPDFYRWL